MPTILSEDNITFLKRFIKSYLSHWVYPFLMEYNKRENNPYRLVISGGDAIYYYINDENLNTKDFDLKIIFADFRDWKYQTNINEYTREPNDSYDLSVAIQYFEELKAAKDLVFTELGALIGKHIIDTFDKVKDIINKWGGEDDVFQNFSVNFGDETVYEYQSAKQVGGFDNTVQLTKTEEDVKNYIRTIPNDSMRSSLLYGKEFDIVLTFENGRTENYYLSEGILDLVTFSPIIFDFTRIYNDKRPIFVFDKQNPENYFAIRDGLQDSTGFLVRNFGVYEHEGLCVVSIDFVLWDSIRMLNSYYYLPYSDFQKERNVKYTQKWSYITTSLFKKLRCVQPFRDACESCIKESGNFLESINKNINDLYQNPGVINYKEPDTSVTMETDETN